MGEDASDDDEDEAVVKKEKKEKKDKTDSSEDEGGDSDSEQDKRKDGENLEWDDEETASVVTTLSSFVSSKGGKPSVADFFEEVRLQQIAKVFDHRMRLYVALEAHCGKTMDAKALGEKQKYVEHLSSNANMSTADVLWAFDTYLKANPGVAKAFPMVLKLLYDEDILEEKQLLEYYNEDVGEGEPGFEDAKAAAAPFLKWLQEAEKQQNDDDEEDDEDSVKEKKEKKE